MDDYIEQISSLQAQALSIYGVERITDHGDSSAVLVHCGALRRLTSAETYHVSTSPNGLVDVLCDIFGECICALMGRESLKMPESVKGVCHRLSRDVFGPKNKEYGNSFGDFGAVGVVIRLLDKAQILRQTGDTRVLPHIANYAIMTLSTILKLDPEAMS